MHNSDFYYQSLSEMSQFISGTIRLKDIYVKFDEYSLYEMCPNTEFFLVRIFWHSHWIRRDTLCLSVFSLNAGKYGPEKTQYLDTFHAVIELVLQQLKDTQEFGHSGFTQLFK